MPSPHRSPRVTPAVVLATALLAAGSAVQAIQPAPAPAAANPYIEFRRSPWFGERTRLERTPDGVRLYVNLPAKLDPALPTRAILFATPNGNTLEESLGAELTPGLSWRFDIQHVAAQVRRLRELRRTENLALIVVQAETKSWPAWRQQHPDNNRVRALAEIALSRIPAKVERVSLTAHSGGGSFLHGFIEADGALPASIDRIAFLDANYSFDGEKHAAKLLEWLRADPSRHFLSLAYDDRNITIDGKLVVGPTGGTFRATDRMVAAFTPLLGAEGGFKETQPGGRLRQTAMDGRLLLDRDLNRENKILHTVLVEQNGLLESLTHGTPEAGKWNGEYRGPRAYTRWVQPSEPTTPVGEEAQTQLPARPENARTGSALAEAAAALPLTEREALWEKELLSGNLPAPLRRFRTVETRMVDAEGHRHTARFQVMPDYLGAGSDTDWLRLPLTPMTAQRLADRWACALPTRRLVDALYAAGEVKLKPQPLTEAREAVATFAQHHRLTEEQRAGLKQEGLTPSSLVAGHKKDVVLTARLRQQPNRVAIYGWHQPDGQPIQPLYLGHKETYVDYSHGIRLISRKVLVDGQPMDYPALLQHPTLWPLASDEGPITLP